MPLDKLKIVVRFNGSGVCSPLPGGCTTVYLEPILLNTLDLEDKDGNRTGQRAIDSVLKSLGQSGRKMLGVLIEPGFLYAEDFSAKVVWTSHRESGGQ
jgi:hypothetical protein|tara:strand:- start:2105 stop:2398 length:294 start_codon:yes stop_codon:yes gene_type:complete